MPPLLPLLPPLPPPPRVLTIAGSDSGGGAGIQADLKTFLSLGAYGLSVVTALTAQSTTGVSAIHAPPASFVGEQLDAVTQDIQVDAVKLGMLCNREIIVTLAQRIVAWKEDGSPLGARGVPLVLDPVMVSTSGSLLLPEDAIAALIALLLPLCTLLTPNLPEAKQLLQHAASASAPTSADGEADSSGRDGPSGWRDRVAPDAYRLRQQTDVAAMVEAAQKLASLGPAAVLVKGGHAQLSRRQALEQIDRLTGGPEREIIPPPEQKWQSAAATDFPARPARDQLRLGASETTGDDDDEDHRRELAALAGLHGATVTRAGNITVVRTDTSPFADVLRYQPSPSSSPHTSGQRNKEDNDSDDQEETVVCDVLYEKGSGASSAGRYTLFVKPYLSATATHGTGCTLSSAVAASLAQGHSLLRSVSIGIDYVQRAIACGIPDLGKGSGPLDHRFPFQARSLLRATPHARFPLMLHLVSNSLPLWTSFTRSAFVLGIADRSITPEGFVYFLRQDYLFLRHYARLWSTAAAFASNTFAEIATFTGIAMSMVKEAELHVSLCARFGITKQQLEVETVESQATLAYTRFVESVGKSGSILDLLVALAPCLAGYAEVGLFLGRTSSTRRPGGAADNPAPREGDDAYVQGLAAWVDGYAGHEFQTAVQDGMHLIESFASRDPPSPFRLEELQKIWNASCRLEISMWDEAIRPEMRREILEP